MTSERQLGDGKQLPHLEEISQITPQKYHSQWNWDTSVYDETLECLIVPVLGWFVGEKFWAQTSGLQLGTNQLKHSLEASFATSMGSVGEYKNVE